MPKLKSVTSFPNIAPSLANKFMQYLVSCRSNYAINTINTRMGNLDYLFKYYGKYLMNGLLAHSHAHVQNAIVYIKNTNPAKNTMSMDISAFKLAWESIHGIEIVRR